MFQLTYTKSAAILRLNLLGKVLYKVGAIVCTFFPLLFLFNNTLSYSLVHLHSVTLNICNTIVAVYLHFGIYNLYMQKYSFYSK